MPKFSVSESITISAPAEQVYAEVREFKRWKGWSPWTIVEPECDLDYAADGKSYSWQGKILGSGSLEVISESAPNRMDLLLTILVPWKSKSDVYFTFEESGGETTVTWAMNSSLPFFLFMMKNMMVSMISMDYCRGLAMLKDVVEIGAVPSTLSYREEKREELSYVGVERETSIADMPSAMESTMGVLKGWLDESGVEPKGPPLTIYHKWDMAKKTTQFTLGAPISNPPENLPEGFVSSRMPSMHAFVIEHTGPYRHLGNAWASGMMRARAKVFKQNKNLQPFEIYIGDPNETPEEELVTEVYFPMKT